MHITGASGSGVTTLGRALAGRTGADQLDTDDFYFFPTQPPFLEKRPISERLRLIEAAMANAGNKGWILSGGIGDWGAPLISRFRLVVFIYTPTPIRMERLRSREALRFGAAAIAPGGWRHEASEYFFTWAEGYETGELGGRSLPYHIAWLANLPCPILKLDGTQPVDALVAQTIVRLTR